MKPNKSGRKIIASNRKALRDYEIIDQIEAGIVLTGYEVKSIRDGKADLQEGFCRIENGEAYLYNIHINPYSHASSTDIDPVRQRKLLLHRQQINRLFGAVQRKGYALVPLSLYFRKGKAKITVALGKGRNVRDKRAHIRDKELNRSLQREFRGRTKI